MNYFASTETVTGLGSSRRREGKEKAPVLLENPRGRSGGSNGTQCYNITPVALVKSDIRQTVLSGTRKAGMCAAALFPKGFPTLQLNANRVGETTASNANRCRPGQEDAKG